MTQSLQRVIDEIQKRPEAEQDFIAALIFEELLVNRDIPQSHKDELERRLAACEADPTAGAPWIEVKARL